jgi:hypothetical protein
MTMGAPKNGDTDSSINECVLMKFRLASGRLLVSLLQLPGRGLGTWKKIKFELQCCNANDSRIAQKHFSLNLFFLMNQKVL